jgi:WD40 repeat protein
MPKYNKFFVFGTKIIYYDANYKEEEKEINSQISDDNYPIKVEFNRYYQQFFVTTFKDIRVYSKDGNIYKTYKKLISNEHFDSDTIIRDFIFENNYRKFYIGFSNGAIMQFNAGNGSLIKAINEHEVEKDGGQNYSYSHFKEISSLYYYHDNTNNLLLISTAYDSLINVYNEEKSEETEQLRTIRGGHSIAGKVNEITCSAFSETLKLFATGSTENLIVVWDFEMSKIDDVFYLSMYREKTSVKCLKFLDPYPVLASSYTDGTLYFWGIRQNKDRGKCIFRARNYYKYHGIDITTVNCMDIYEGKLREMRYDVPLRKYFDENSPFMNQNKVYVAPKKKNSKK